MKKRKFTLALLAAMVSLCAGGLSTASPVLASGDVNQGVCPNENNTGFSAELPDCRAYEQVSPVFKDGFPLDFDYLLAEGERVQGESVGLFAGATANEAFPFSYDLARTSAGWVTSAIDDVPLDEFAYAGESVPPVLLNDGGASLLELHPASKSVYERDLYLHEPDGTFVPVGPMLPSYAVPAMPTGSAEQSEGQPPLDYVDATPDFSHVLFALAAKEVLRPPGVTNELWPGDTTRPAPSLSPLVTSLYEYVGTNNTTPTLVGVDNNGHLISDCGTTPGGWEERGSGNDLNVISEDGSRVFFTAVGEGDPKNAVCVGVGVVPPVNELFARVGGTRTLAISEPKALSSTGLDAGCTSGECQENITETAAFRDANYEKASRDGSKVFFTSTQQLLDGATQDSNEEDSAALRQEGSVSVKGCTRTTPGTGGCNLYEYDLDEDPTSKQPVGLSLVSGGDSSGLGPQVQGVAAVSEDGSHVYFVAKGVLTREPRAALSGECIGELDSAELAVEESTKEGKCRPKQGEDNLYVYDTLTRETQFIATLGKPDAAQWSINGPAEPMNVTDDGRFLVFTSLEHIVAGDASSVRQVFRYDAQTGALVRVSLGDEGQNGLGESLISRRASSPAKEQVDSDAHPAISENGAYVVFVSSEALVPGALSNECVSESEPGACNYAYNIYEYHEGQVYLISRGDADPGAPEISQSGRDIFFQTPESLVPQDTDTLPDLYDARIGGGFAVSGSVPCKEEACQGSVSAAPVFAAPVSATFSGSGNPTPTAVVPTPKSTVKKVVKCKKPKKPTHGKCAKPSKKAKKGRNASNDRRINR